VHLDGISSRIPCLNIGKIRDPVAGCTIKRNILVMLSMMGNHLP
jgi:hypothetical protein